MHNLVKIKKKISKSIESVKLWCSGPKSCERGSEMWYICDVSRETFRFWDPSVIYLSLSDVSGLKMSLIWPSCMEIISDQQKISICSNKLIRHNFPPSLSSLSIYQGVKLRLIQVPMRLNFSLWFSKRSTCAISNVNLSSLDAILDLGNLSRCIWFIVVTSL